MIATQKSITWWQYAYYLVLLLIMATWTDTFSPPPLVLRLSFLAALFIVPLRTLNNNLIPAVLSCFVIVSTYGFSYSYLPSTYSLYCIPVLLCMFRSINCRQHRFSIPFLFIALCIYTLIINGVTSFRIHQLTYCYFILILFILMLDTEINIDYKIVATFLAFASIALCLYYFLFGYRFTEAYGTSGIDRAGWTDPNYFSTTLGFSALTSISMMLIVKNNLLEKILYTANIVMTLMVMVMVASRGGIISLAAGLFVLILLSKIKNTYKILFILLLTAFVLFLYNNNYFQLLQYRFEMDESGGSGRIDIWQMKLNAFFESSPYNWLFGLGFEDGTILGGTKLNYLCFHNDFVAYLICYGVVGFAMFILFLTYPIRFTNRNHRLFPIILSLIVYLVVTSFTLQPMCEGMLEYFCDYFFILLLMQNSITDSLRNE